jgi:hypothetical protein
MIQSLVRLALFLAAVSALSCGTSPAAPSPFSRAGVSINVVSATAETIPTGARYRLQYDVRETSGLSGVTLIVLRHTFPSGVVAETDTRRLEGAARAPRVAPATTLRVGYEITVEPSAPESSVTITLTFTDDEGRSGSANPVSVPVTTL